MYVYTRTTVFVLQQEDRVELEKPGIKAYMNNTE